MYFNTTYIANNYQEVSVEELQPGDCFVKAGVHCRLFYEWGEDNNVITIEATSGTYNRVLQYEYDLYQDIINQGYVLRRNVPLSAGNDLPENGIKLWNYPNPFNPTTTISFCIEQNQQNEQIKIELYNLKGQKVKTLACINRVDANARDSRSTYSVAWDGTDQNDNPVASGIYLYRLKAGEVEISRKCLLLK